MHTASPTVTGATLSGRPLLVKLAEQADFGALDAMPRGADRKQAAWELLQRTASATQAEEVALADQLRDEGLVTRVERLTSPNMLVVTPVVGKSQQVANAFHVPGVQTIYDNSGTAIWSSSGAAVTPPGIVSGPTWGHDTDEGFQLVGAPTETPYGVKAIGAPEAWQQGADGAGLVFGSVDTGADATHDAIRDAYRGARADGTVDHDYSWIDFEEGRPSPVDARGHGTHTIGTVTGKTVGVAPAARWISARALSGRADDAVRALQWMQAPTRRDGSAPRPDLAPDVVGISWWMGKPTQNLFEESIRNLRGAGIEVVKSAGNQGPGAGTVTSPGQYPEILSIGAVDERGTIADFSSRGPAPWPHGGSTPKPDFAAPGVDVVSSLPRNRYGKYSGTSMAQPHASGAILDILSKYPTLTHEQLVAAMAAGATDGGKPGVDAAYGNGVIDIPRALAAAGRMASAATPAV